MLKLSYVIELKDRLMEQAGIYKVFREIVLILSQYRKKG